MENEAMYERERELNYLISQAHHRAMQAFQDEIAPWVKELSDIELCKPAKPIVLADGRVMRYVGPVATWTPDGITMP